MDHTKTRFGSHVFHESRLQGKYEKKASGNLSDTGIFV